MFEPTLVGSFSRMVNFLRISWSILSPSVVNFYAHLVNSRCRLHHFENILNICTKRGDNSLWIIASFTIPDLILGYKLII